MLEMHHGAFACTLNDLENLMLECNVGLHAFLLRTPIHMPIDEIGQTSDSLELEKIHLLGSLPTRIKEL